MNRSGDTGICIKLSPIRFKDTRLDGHETILSPSLIIPMKFFGLVYTKYLS